MRRKKDRPYGEALFDRAPDGELVKLSAKDVRFYRARLCYAGEMLEADFYPCWTPAAKRSARASVTPAAQAALNRRNSKKQYLRYLYANFGRSDLYISLDFKHEPADLAEAKRQVGNYIRRLKRLCGSDLKYLYYIHGGHDGKKGRVRFNVHIFISAMDRDAAEAAWTKGGANTKRLKPEVYEGLERIGLYTAGKRSLESAEDGPFARRWGRSRNLKKPEPVYPSHRISRRRASLIAKDKEAAAEQIAREFPGYVLQSLDIRISDHVGGAYMYALLRKRE